MTLHSLVKPALAVACAVTMSGCQAMSPTSPTGLNSSGTTTRRLFEEIPAPVTTTINIVGTAGDIAFNPNPIQAAIGDLIVWMNGDTRLHHIVLDDGTDIGDVMPGQASTAIAVATTAATGFHCTIHPSMVGTINGEIQPPPPYYAPPTEPDPYY